jgi:hypothetical protein
MGFHLRMARVHHAQIQLYADMLSSGLRSDVVAALAVGLALVWLWAAAGKFLRPLALDQVLAAVPPLQRLPVSLTSAAIRMLPFVEILLALSLVPLTTRPMAAVASGVLLLSFALALAIGLVSSALRDSVADPKGTDTGASAVAKCGCFGRAAAAPDIAKAPGTLTHPVNGQLHAAGWHVARPLLLAAVAFLISTPCRCS